MSYVAKKVGFLRFFRLLYKFYHTVEKKISTAKIADEKRTARAWKVPFNNSPLSNESFMTKTINANIIIANTDSTAIPAIINPLED